MSSTIESVARDPLSLILAGLGISFAPYEYIGGLILGLAGASIAFAMSRDTDRRRLWLVMLTAVFASHLAALTAGYILPKVPPQFVMAIVGFGSYQIARIALKVFGQLEERSDKIADKIVDRVVKDDDK